MKIRITLHRMAALLLALLMAASLMACAKDHPVAPSTTAAAPSSETSHQEPLSSAETPSPSSTAPAPSSETPPQEPLPSAETSIPPSTAPEELEEMRQTIKSASAVCGILYLGYTEKTLTDEGFFSSLQNQDALSDYPFIMEIDPACYAKNDGGEVYCIIPADPKTQVTVTAWNAEILQPGELLYQSDRGEPFLIQGNVSDIMENMSITMTDGQDPILKEYHPYISLKDGTVVTVPQVLDLTEDISSE